MGKRRQEWSPVDRLYFSSPGAATQHSKAQHSSSLCLLSLMDVFPLSLAVPSARDVKPVVGTCIFFVSPSVTLVRIVNSITVTLTRGMNMESGC